MQLPVNTELLLSEVKGSAYLLHYATTQSGRINCYLG